MRKLMILTSVVVLAASMAPSAQGQGNGKGKGKGNAQSEGSSLSLVMYYDQNANGAPNWGDLVTFAVSTTETTDPKVEVICFQNGDVVFGAVWPTTPVLTLSSQSWRGGAAECKATAYYFSGNKNSTIASLNFTAYE